MKLYLLTRNDNVGWDEYSGAVIAAATPQEARGVMCRLAQGDFDWKCTLISNTTTSKVRRGIVLDSFNAD